MVFTLPRSEVFLREPQQKQTSTRSVWLKVSGPINHPPSHLLPSPPWSCFSATSPATSPLGLSGSTWKTSCKHSSGPPPSPRPTGATETQRPTAAQERKESGSWAIRREKANVAELGIPKAVSSLKKIAVQTDSHPPILSSMFLFGFA